MGDITNNSNQNMLLRSSEFFELMKVIYFQKFNKKNIYFQRI